MKQVVQENYERIKAEAGRIVAEELGVADTLSIYPILLDLFAIAVFFHYILNSFVRT